MRAALSDEVLHSACPNRTPPRRRRQQAATKGRGLPTRAVSAAVADARTPNPIRHGGETPPGRFSRCGVAQGHRSASFLSTAVQLSAVRRLAQTTGPVRGQ